VPRRFAQLSLSQPEQPDQPDQPATPGVATQPTSGPGSLTPPPRFGNPTPSPLEAAESRLAVPKAAQQAPARRVRSAEEGYSLLPEPLHPHVQEHEAASLTPGQAKRFVHTWNHLVEAFPQETGLASIRAGQAKRGWYQDFAEQITSIFEDDTPRFVALLAATSPNDSVKRNMKKALLVWHHFLIDTKQRRARGRKPPSDEELRHLVLRWLPPGFGNKTLVPNIIKALTADKADLAIQSIHGAEAKPLLSGPKVEPFRENLLGNLGEVTIDTWMAHAFGLPEAGEGGQILAQKTRVRYLAAAYNKQLAPGEKPWQPAEVQEVVWSLIRAVAYLQGKATGIKKEDRKKPRLSDEAILENLTHKLVEGNADFLSLLTGEQGYAGEESLLDILRGHGLDQAADRMQAAARRIIRSPRPKPQGNVQASLLPGEERHLGPLFRRAVQHPTLRLNRPGPRTRLAKTRLVPDANLLALAQDYLRKHHLPPHADFDYLPLDEARSYALADLYEQLQHAPHSPEVQAAYQAMKAEVLAQYRHLKAAGYQLLPWQQAGQPYQNSQEMRADVLNNKRLHYFTGGDLPSDHPLAEVEPESGQTFNDLFRAVHDVFGHALYGNQFGPRGEEHAWRAHASMFSPLARRAMTTETRGQNSWVNFGPHLRGPHGQVAGPGEPGHVPPPQRPYAPQKAGLLPPEHISA
jgi:hypothetical protein